MNRPDMISPRPLQPAQSDRFLSGFRHEPRCTAVQEGALPLIRKGMQNGVMPGARPVPPPQPLLILAKGS